MKVSLHALIVVPVLLTIMAALVEAEERDSDESALEVVVTGTRIEAPQDKLGTSLSVISGEELENQAQSNVSQSLLGLPGLDVVTSGSNGGNTAIFIRGGNSEHTLVLIDGVEANNPATPARNYNFADLQVNNIERIEVLRGPQSMLYGSDALAGVINIVTKKGQAEPRFSGSVEAGSYRSSRETVGVTAGGQGYDFSFGAAQENSHGPSAAGASYGNTEHDSYGNASLSSRVGFTPLDFLKGQVVMRYLEAETDLDNFGGFGGDDPNRRARDEQLFMRAQLTGSFFDKMYEPSLGLSLSDQSFEDNNDVDAQHPFDAQRSEYSGDIQKADWQNYLRLDEYGSMILGAETEVEEARSEFLSDSEFGEFRDDFSKRSATNNAVFAQVQSQLADVVFPRFGVRLDGHSKFGSEITWQFAPVVNLRSSGTKLSATVGRGFKAPSLFQLYSSYGNQNLEAEKSLGLDAGVEQQLWGPKLVAGVTYFRNDYENLISFEPDTFLFMNINDAITQGLESYLRAALSECVTLTAGYTYTDTRDKQSGESLLRRSRNKVSAGIDYLPFDAASVRLEMLYNGPRFDNDFSLTPAARRKLGGYVSFNLVARYEVSPSLELFTRVENIFDREYEEVFGYGTNGAAAYAGLRVKL